MQELSEYEAAIVARFEAAEVPAEVCRTCRGRTRETVDRVCQTCGTDYAPVTAVDGRPWATFVDSGDARFVLATITKTGRQWLIPNEPLRIARQSDDEATRRVWAQAWLEGR